MDSSQNVNGSGSGSGKSPFTAPVAAGLIIGGLVLAGGGFAVGKLASDKTETTSTSSSSMNDMDMASSDKASDLRATLVGLGVVHQDQTQLAINAALDGNADADATKAALIQNGADISAAIGSVYGDDAKTKFNDIWTKHLVAFVNYAVAAKGGNAAGKASALADIDANYTKPIVSFLSTANPNLPADVLTTAFNDHISMTAAIIDDHVAGNFTKEQTDQAAAVKHIQSLMSTLSGAIVKQYPDKF